MFRFFRKHRWLLIVAMAITAITFVTFMGSGPSRNNGGGNVGDYGKIYGHEITQQDYRNAQNDFYITYWIHNHEWPDKNPNIKPKDIEQETYVRLMLELKAESLGIRVGDQAAAAAAGNVLRSLDPSGQPVSVAAFVQQVLQPAGLTADDFERFARTDTAIQELMETMALAGTLITPQEIAAAYQRDHQEVSAQFVLFAASNFLSQVTVTPAAVGQFYTNYLAQYRLPDRVQVSYVEFNLSNYLEQSKAEWAKTNLEETVNAEFTQYGLKSFPEAKTADDAKAILREDLIRRRAMFDARAQANAFATEVFNLNPARSENLAVVAKQKGLTVHLTAPFSATYGPAEITGAAAFTKAAFALNTDEPIADPVAGSYAYYVMALDKKLPSEIPPLDQIRDQVTRDFQMTAAAMLAQHAGTNFVATLDGQLTGGHTFASVCIAAGLHPVTLPTFSLSSADLPELDNHLELNQFLRLVANTPTGHASPLVATEDGGLIVFVQSRRPVDQATMNAGLPQFAAAMRRQRRSEVFNQWLQIEGSRELRNTPIYLQQSATGAK